MRTYSISICSIGFISICLYSLVFAESELPTLPLDTQQEIASALTDALELHNMQVAEKWNLATDPNERYEHT